MRTVSARMGVLALSAWMGACAAWPSPGVPDAETQLREAVGELEREEFAAATSRLEAIVSTCTGDREERRALLLLAAAELDTANPDGSPATAARVAERYLMLPTLSADERILARALYRAAAQAERLALLLDESEAQEAPSLPGRCTNTEHTREIPRTALLGTARAPWALTQDATITGLRGRVGALQAEIDRITSLLTTDVTGNLEEPGR